MGRLQRAAAGGVRFMRRRGFESLPSHASNCLDVFEVRSRWATHASSTRTRRNVDILETFLFSVVAPLKARGVYSKRSSK
eukprot:3455814-Pleurochrysis_carterae.AAC.1